MALRLPRPAWKTCQIPRLVAALLKRGVSDEDVANVVGKNLLRVWKQVDEVALEMQAKGALPIEDDQFGMDAEPFDF